jgi:hypothetical protein
MVSDRHNQRMLYGTARPLRKSKTLLAFLQPFMLVAGGTTMPPAWKHHAGGILTVMLMEQNRSPFLKRTCSVYTQGTAILCMRLNTKSHILCFRLLCEQNNAVQGWY